MNSQTFITHTWDAKTPNQMTEINYVKPIFFPLYTHEVNCPKLLNTFKHIQLCINTGHFTFEHSFVYYDNSDQKL